MTWSHRESFGRPESNWKPLICPRMGGYLIPDLHPPKLPVMFPPTEWERPTQRTEGGDVLSLISSTGRHQAEKDSWWQRRSRKGKVGIVTAIFMAFAGVAIALFFLIAGQFSGTIQGADYQMDLTAINASVPPVHSTAAPCPVTLSSGEISFNSWAPLPNETCSLWLTFAAGASNSGAMVLQGVNFPAELSVTVWPDDCSPATKTWAASDSKDVIAQVEYVGALGQNVDLTAAVYGFQFVRLADHTVNGCTYVPA